MRAVAFVLTLSSLVVACGPDLGACDMALATKLVYFNGTPFTEGQGLVYQSCAGSFCHAEVAAGLARSGAPHGLNFDVQTLRKGATTAQLDMLTRGINEVRDEADELWGVIDNGTMPPGKVGERPYLPWYSDSEGKVPAMLQGLDYETERDKVRNWLACAAPIVAATTDSEQAEAAKGLGPVLPPGKAGTTATFQSIYDSLLTTCTSCHGATSPYKNQALNFSTKDAAYMSLVGKMSFSGTDAQCANHTLVKAGDCMGSLLYQKIALPKTSTGFCGETMPLAGMQPSAELQKAVCDWITAGAMP